MKQKTYPHILFTSPNLDLALSNPTTAGSNLSHYHIGSKAVRFLPHAGIRTLGDLIRHAALPKKGRKKIEGIGPSTHAHLTRFLTALSHSITPTGDIDEKSLLELQGIPTLAADVENNPKRLLQTLGSTLQKAVREQFSEKRTRGNNANAKRYLAILKDRILPEPNAHKILEDMGEEAGTTREAIRLKEREILRMLSACMAGNNAVLKFRLGQGAMGLLQQAKTALGSHPNTVWAPENWDKFLANLWDVPRKEIYKLRPTLMVLLGFESHKTPIGTEKEFLAPEGVTIPLARIERASKVIGDELRNNIPGITEAELHNSLKEKKTDVDSPTLRNILSACSGEEYDAKCWRLKFTEIKTLGDMAERILTELEEPTSVHEILRIIKARRPGNDTELRILGSATAADPRFTPIGGTGMRALTAWGVKNMTIPQALEHALKQKGEPMTKEELLKEVRKLRPCEPGSLTLYLLDKAKFTRVDRKTYALPSWGLPSAKRYSGRGASKQTQAIIQSALEIISERKEVPLGKLVEKVSKDLIIPREKLYATIRKCSEIKVYPEGQSKHKICTLAPTS